MALKVDDKLEEVHEELLTWASSIGVEVDRIRPMRISGRGFGGKSALECSRVRCLNGLQAITASRIRDYGSLFTKSILLPYAYTAYPMAGEDTVTNTSSQSWQLITFPKTSIFSQSPSQP